jgi:hypothetical protein
LYKTLLIYCDYGRLGNRLHTHANALAWCIHNNYNLINLSFSNYADLFDSQPKHASGNFHNNKDFIFRILSTKSLRHIIRRVLLSDKWLRRLSWIINQITPTDDELIDENDLHQKINHKKINLIRHWDLNCTNLIKIHQNNIRRYLKPNKSSAVCAEKKINQLRSRYDCIIGIHARRGDYASYLDGIHYHKWESYLNWGNQTINTLKNSGKKNVGIIVCSDEIPPLSITDTESFYFSSNDDFIVDLHILSLCDYNIGPPSSFGSWISWYGKVPRYNLSKNSKINSIDQFKVCLTC